jgi:hypothetical protein
MTTLEPLSDDVSMSPQSNAPKMIEVRTALPPDIWKQMQEVASEEGWKDAEFLRVCVVMGFHAYCSGNNSVLVNKKVRDRLKKLAEGVEPDDD